MPSIRKFFNAYNYEAISRSRWSRRRRGGIWYRTDHGGYEERYGPFWSRKLDGRFHVIEQEDHGACKFDRPETSDPKPWPDWARYLVVGVALGAPLLFQVYCIAYLLWAWIAEGPPKLPNI